MPKEKEEKEKQPQKQLGEEKSEKPQESKETNQRLNAIETRLGRMEANLNTDHSEVKAALETSNTLLDSIMKYLDQKIPSSGEVEPLEWDPNKIVWEKTVSRKSGNQYDRSDNMNNPDFRSMREDLERQGGKLTRDNMFYWNFDNSTVVGRTKSRYPKNK